MKTIMTYLAIIVLLGGNLQAKTNHILPDTTQTKNAKTSKNLEIGAWFFIKPNNSNVLQEFEISGKSNILMQNLGVFNGISNRDKSIFFKLDKGIVINNSAIFGTDKIKTPRTSLAINSALHFSNGAKYEFRDASAGSGQNWDNLSGNNLEGTVVVPPSQTTFVDGYVSYDGPGLFVFPVGNGTSSGTYRPITINGRSGQTITTAWLSGDPNGANDPTDSQMAHSRSALSGDIKLIYESGQWDWHIRTSSESITNNVAPANVLPSGSISISVPIPADINVLTKGILNNLRLVGWNGTTWEALSNSVTGSGVITASANKVFSAITFGAVENGPLPVNLITFTASTEANTTVLDWETASENNSRSFEIERSSNGKSWFGIGKLKASENSDSLSKYHFVDTTPLTGENYYRLKMIDLDNSFAYSTINRVNFQSGSGEIVLYPNPVSDVLSIKSGYGWNNVANVSIYNQTGRLIYNSPSKPLNTIDVSNFAAGKYIVCITAVTGKKDSYNIIVRR